MRTLFVLTISTLFVVAAFGQSTTDCYNGFGIYLEPSPEILTNYTEYLGPIGTITAYLVLANPYNENTGQPITNLGGYEFRLVFPSHLQVSYVLHGGATNFTTAPVFFVGFTEPGLPVVDRQVLLITLEIEAATDEPAFWTIEEHVYCGMWPCPPEIYVTDADDDYSLSQATPVSYDLEAPVFCMFGDCDSGPGGYPRGGSGGVWGDCWVVPTARASWGDIKAMYR